MDARQPKAARVYMNVRVLETTRAIMTAKEVAELADKAARRKAAQNRKRRERD